MITDRAAGETATDLADRCHPACFTCGVQNGDGLGLQSAEEPDGTVAGSFVCEGKHQGFPGWLHGAVMPMLVDAAMPPGLFVHRIKTVTGKLKPRFPRPVKVGVAATVRACKEAGHA